MPLILPVLKIDDRQIKRVESTKFLGVLIDENLTWKDHIKYVESKISKNLGLLYKAKNYLNKKALMSLYFSYIHPFVNYGNIVWASSNRTNLKKINSQQKHAVRMIHNENRFAHTRNLMKSSNILNVYQLNVFNVLVFMHKIKTKTAPAIFLGKFNKVSHSYPTNFGLSNFTQPAVNLTRSKSRITVRGPKLWNDFLSKTEKELEQIILFKNKVRAKIFNTDNEIKYF